MAIALGLEAIRRGYTVRFRRASDLVNQMSEAQNERQLSRYIKALNNCHILACSELCKYNITIIESQLLCEVECLTFDFTLNTSSHSRVSMRVDRRETLESSIF